MKITEWYNKKILIIIKLAFFNTLLRLNKIPLLYLPLAPALIAFIPFESTWIWSQIHMDSILNCAIYWLDLALLKSSGCRSVLNYLS